MSDQRLPQHRPLSLAAMGLAARGLGFAEEVKEMQTACAVSGSKAAPALFALSSATTGPEQACRAKIDALPEPEAERSVES